MRKLQSSPYLKSIEQIKELNRIFKTDESKMNKRGFANHRPGGLPNIQSRLLSPLSRAERVLKRRHRSRDKNELKFDSSIEASLEKIDDPENFLDKNDKFITLFASSASSEKPNHLAVATHEKNFDKHNEVSSPERAFDEHTSSKPKSTNRSRNSNNVLIKQRTENLKMSMFINYDMFMFWFKLCNLHILNLKS